MEITNLTPAGNERCIICGEDTGVSVAIPIEFRNNYLEGQGQLCLGCARIYNAPPASVSPPEESFGLPHAPPANFS